MNMVNTMKIKFMIQQPNDSQKFHSVSWLFSTLKKSSFPWLYSGYSRPKSRALNIFGEHEIKTDRLTMTTTGKTKIDPVVELLTLKIKKKLFPSRQDTSVFMNTLTRKFPKQKIPCTIFYGRTHSGSFILNGKKMSKEDLLNTISKIIIRSTICDDPVTLDNYIDKIILYPSNVLYALENRTPYKFYLHGVKQDVRINTKLVSAKEIALEISDGIWGIMSIKEMNTFVNTFKHGSERSKKWFNISPRRLWFTLLGINPSETQHSLMIAWLVQNRTKDMVDKRAEVLLESLNNVPNLTYIPNCIHRVNLTRMVISPSAINNANEQTEITLSPSNFRKAVLVRGQLMDWLIIAKHNATKHQGFQLVDSHCLFREELHTGADVGILAFNHNDTIINLRANNICIDNVQNNSSVGDQLSTRAYIAMNDKVVADNNLIHTIVRQNDREGKERLSDEEFESLKSQLLHISSLRKEESL